MGKRNTKYKKKRAKRGSKNITKKVRFEDDENNSVNMNCNPIADKEKVVGNSCYTESALNQIKDAYNANHNTNTIISVEPKEIWTDLRNKLNHCSKEDCWLDEIKERDTRRQLDEIIFAPDRPNEWEKNPIAWLSNYDIAAVLRQYERSNPEFKLLGPSAIDYDTKPDGDKCVWDDLCRLSLDNLQNRGKRKLGVVFNLDKHYQNGSHWVSMFIDLDKHTIFYYDSAVNPVPREVSRLKKEIIAQGKKLSPPINFDYIQNDYSHQTTNTECGMYCLFFIITWLTQRADKSIMDKSEHKMIGGRRVKISFEELIKIFTKPGINDQMMIRFRDIYFNKK